MTLEITTEFDYSEIEDDLDDIENKATDFHPVFERIRDDLEDHWKANFTSNGLRVGGWAPLDAGYAAWKSIHFPGATPMIQTGQLFRSLSDLHGSPNDIGAHEARFGTDIEHAKFHQLGTSKMPKRQLVYEPAEAGEKWGRWAKNYLAGSSLDMGDA
jgi:phage gpG-like protein